MVSIPDWSRLGRLGEPPKQPVVPYAKYHKQRAEDVIKQAKEQGYFLTPTRSFIEDKFLPSEEQRLSKKKSLADALIRGAEEKDLGIVKMILLDSLHLRTVGDIGRCQNLQICDLSNNYIRKIDALVACTQLYRLVLNSNQISMVPEPSFWSCLKKLKILNLHDNPLGRIDNLHHLAGCPELTALTLYDTPLSLKRNYRHHVVNSIWTLKALDNYVISDEEIIEDAHFGGKFSPLLRALRVELCPPHQGGGLEKELERARQVLVEVNHVMAHNSPVLIIQRFVRGFLVRKSCKFVQDARIWATVTIQRKYRSGKGIDLPKEMPGTPPTTAVKDLGTTPRILDVSKLDYDTYLLNRRPGSTVFSENSFSSRLSKPTHSKQLQKSHLTSTQPLPEPPVNSAQTDVTLQKRANLHLDLARLQTGGRPDGPLESFTVDPFPTDRTILGYDQQQKTEMKKSKKKKLSEKSKKRMMSINHFFGAVVPPAGPDDDDDEVEAELVGFRLRGLRQQVYLTDPLSEMILSKKETGYEIRAAEDQFHRNAEKIPKPKIEKKTVANNNQRIFGQVQGTMAFSCLDAIHKAYSDREKSEKRTSRLQRVFDVKEDRQANKERIRLYHDEKRNKTLREREQDQKRTIEIIEKRKLDRLSYLRRNQIKRKKSAHRTKQLHAEWSFMGDFNVQNISVSNALLRHDIQAKMEDTHQQIKEALENKRALVIQEKEVMTKYLEHRQLMRQAETAMARAAIDRKMIQESSDRLINARARVARLKNLNNKAHPCYYVPNVSRTSIPIRREDNVESLQEPASPTPEVEARDPGDRELTSVTC